MGKNPQEVQDYHERHWEFVRNLTREEYDEQGWDRNKTKGWYRCKHCGKEISIIKYQFKRCYQICPNECNGVRHGNSAVVLKGVNDLATTHPHVVKYLTNPEDANTQRMGSHKKVKARCPICGYEKSIRVNHLARLGLMCNACSNTIPYSERFIANLFSGLSTAYNKGLSLDQGKTRYDFCLPDYNVIIETHGIQHYEGGFKSFGGRTLEEEQTNDKYKMELALSKGYKYIVLDCRYSKMEWIKNSILNSELINLFDLSNIDWNELAKSSEKNLVFEVCKFYEDTKLSHKKIAEHFGIGKTTVGRYLRKGRELGICSYTPKEVTVNE